MGYYLNHYHYLGFNQTVGENIKYLVRDRSGHNVACLLFGSAAWKTAPRDSFIGWNRELREKNINFITNNTRFLILPQIRVPHLASHILGCIIRRIQKDWRDKYTHPIYMVETFVERDLFKGTCYKAANWLCVGQTRGRSRQDRYLKLSVPVKDILLYPLTKKLPAGIMPGEKIMLTRTQLLNIAKTNPETLVEIILVLQEQVQILTLKVIQLEEQINKK